MGVDFFSFRFSIYLVLLLSAFKNNENDREQQKTNHTIDKKIPKKIHYIWIGGKPLPKHIQKCIDSWHRECPDFEIKRWDESNLNLGLCKYVEEAYAAKKFAFASDVLRFDVLAKEGGIYLDVDVFLHKSLTDLLSADLFMGFETEKSVAPGLIVGAVKNNKLLLEILEEYKTLSFVKNDGYDTTTVCQIVTEILKEKGFKINNETQELEGIKLYSSEYFCPYNPVTSQRNVTANTYATHLYLSSWYTKRQKIKSRMKKILNFFTNGYFGLFLVKFKEKGKNI